jgi:hypothetical protein
MGEEKLALRLLRFLELTSDEKELKDGAVVMPDGDQPSKVAVEALTVQVNKTATAAFNSFSSEVSSKKRI